MNAERLKWERAQVLEHGLNAPVGQNWAELREHFRRVYELYLLLTGAGDLTGKSVLEIGGSGFPAVSFVEGCSRRVLIEPDYGDHLRDSVRGTTIEVIARPAEEVDFPTVDEVWLFNVLQHVLDPDLLVRKAQAAAPVIRFFEPLDQGMSDVHLHSFSMGWYQERFGFELVREYPGVSFLALPLVGFHTARCAYGAWRR